MGKGRGECWPGRLHKPKTSWRPGSLFHPEQLCTCYPWGVCESTPPFRNDLGAEGPSVATENLFVVLLGEFSSHFCIFHFFFFCPFTIPFMQGLQIPSQSSIIFIKCRPIYTCYHKMCGPEINILPNQPNPRVLYSWNTVNGKKNQEPDAESPFQLHSY